MKFSGYLSVIVALVVIRSEAIPTKVEPSANGSAAQDNRFALRVDDLLAVDSEYPYRHSCDQKSVFSTRFNKD